MKGRSIVLITAVLILALTASIAYAAVIRVAPDGNDANDGSTWLLAMQHVQAAIDAAAAGDQVWVKYGTYVENLTLDSGVALYGGFQGTETTLSARPAFPRALPDEYETVLDGNNSASVVLIAQSAVASTRVDGFTIRNGRSAPSQGIDNCGGGIYINGGSPIIVNNHIIDNRAVFIYGSTQVWGGGIYSLDSEAIIANNVIEYNSATDGGSGIACKGGAPVIINNTINNNDDVSISIPGGGIACINNSGPSIINNTIVCNGGSGVYTASGASSTVFNNIIAGNRIGIDEALDACGTFHDYNCISGNLEYDTYLVLADHDISVDPLLVSTKWGNFHIQANSPCRDAGDDTMLGTGWLDMDGQNRVQGNHVDIGADESDGTMWDTAPLVLRVSNSGDDSYSGLSWQSPLQTIQHAIDTAVKNGGGEIWVKTGTYEECINLGRRIYLYGGFDGSETSLSQRKLQASACIIDGQQQDTVVKMLLTGKLAGEINGFTIRNGQGAPDGGAYFYGGGIFSKAGLIIKNNIVTDNEADGYGAGISCGGDSTIVNNIVCNNTCFQAGAGIYYTGYFSGVIASNLVYNNTVTNDSYGAGAGIYCNGTVIVANNTIVGNVAPNGGGYYGDADVTNNIIAFNSTDIGGGPTLSHNCIYGNTGGDNPGPTDISVDPLFVDMTNNDYHIRPTSPCINVGENSVVQSGWLDMDLQSRICSDGVSVADIGADEFYYKIATPVFSPDAGAYDAPQTVTITCSTPGAVIHYTTNGSNPTTSDPVYTAPISVSGVTVLKAKAFQNTWVSSDVNTACYKVWGSYSVVRVDGVNGSDTNDGSTWALAKKTITSACSAVTAGGEIWVKGGAYNWKSSIPSNIGFFGGFAGTETRRDQRDWVANPTILDGSGYLFINDTNGATEFDGFTVQNGSYYVGAGMIAYGNPLISHNKFLGNQAQYIGGAIAASNGTPRIVGNIFADNDAPQGGSIHCGYNSAAIIVNNTFEFNTATDGSVVYMAATSSPTVCNNATYWNTNAFKAEAGAKPLLRNNYVYRFSYDPGYMHSGLVPGEGDILSCNDTGTFDSEDNNYSLTATSQCLDAGWEDAPCVPALDIDGQPMRFGPIDIGANELYIIRVSNTGDDSNSGRLWDEPKQTIQAALDVAKTPVDVWVKTGDYYEYVTMTTGDRILGGFDGTETSGSDWERDWFNDVTVIDSIGAASNVSIVNQTATRAARVSGFTIQNGAATEGGGIYCSGSPLIDHNRIQFNGAEFGAGICVADGSPVIANNLILRNESSGCGGGIYCAPGSSPALFYNTITYYNETYGGDGGAVYMCTGSAPVLKNNIIYQNLNSVYAASGANPSLEHNLIWAGSYLGYSYSGLNPGVGDISDIPQFADTIAYRLLSTSPCIDAGVDFNPYSYGPGHITSLDYFKNSHGNDGNGDGVYKNDMGANEYNP